MSNQNLLTAKNKKNDEFYTRLEDIQKELNNYKEYFKDKIIYCNCDDIYTSNFYKYFKDNFNKLGIKKIAYKIIDTFSCADQQKFGFLALKYKEKEKMKVREEYLKEFNKLYNLALKDCMALLEQIHDNLSQKKIADIAFDKPAI